MSDKQYRNHLKLLFRGTKSDAQIERRVQRRRQWLNELHKQESLASTVLENANGSQRLAGAGR
jgi:hypothetical protein